MTTPDSESKRQRTILFLLVGVIVVAVGVVLGLVIGSGSDEPVAADSTVTSSSSLGTTAPTTATTIAANSTSSAPTTSTTPSTLPSDIGADLIIPASADATIESESPDEASGGSDELVADTDSSDFEHSLLSFEVEGIPDDATIAQVTLRLFVLDSSGAPQVAEVDGTWSESGVNWDNAPAVGEVIGEVPDVPDESYARVDVTSVVRGNGPVGFYLINEADDSFVAASRESGNGPVLEIILGGSETVMVGAGDIAGCDSDGDEATADLIQQVVSEEEDTLVFTLGDNAYEDGTPANFADCYHPSWGQFKDITRPATGTRDYRTPSASGYFSYFGSVAGDPEEGFYSYDYGGWHVVVLNSNCDEVGGCNEGSAQANWLQEDLASSEVACTIGYWHHPAFGSTADGVNNDVIPLWEILYADGAEIVLNGDHHFYERFAPQDPTGVPDENGLMQFTVGTGGRSLAEIGSPAANSEVRFDEAFGVLVLTMTPSGYGWEFRTAPDSAVVDSGTASCH
jgi:hypothetical protein